MIDLKLHISCLSAKIILSILRLTKSGGTALPGLIALKIDNKIIEKLSNCLKCSIVICGTNGKTTTTRIISSIFKSASRNFIHNRTGSNLLRGIASTLIDNKSLILKKQKELIGLWEVDEAVLPSAIKKLKPKFVLINNLFRDQLDRYGEIDSLAKKWKAALNNLSKDTIVILNADDPTVGFLGKNLDCQVLYFGLQDKSLGSKTLSHASDATVCPYCLLPLKYSACFVSHLGIYVCVKCEAIQPLPNIRCTQVKFLEENYSQITTKDYLGEYILKINLQGIYNIYNALAAFSMASALKIEPKKISEGFESFKPAFGRFEKIKIGKKTLMIILVKNPAGFNETLKTLVDLVGNNSFSCLIVLNDLLADGQDVSWIWDVDFENLKKISNLEKIIFSGIRAEDMALRIKYSGWGLTGKNWEMEKNIRIAIDNLLSCPSKDLFILSTYTALLQIRKILNQIGLVHWTWRD